MLSIVEVRPVIELMDRLILFSSNIMMMPIVIVLIGLIWRIRLEMLWVDRKVDCWFWK